MNSRRLIEYPHSPPSSQSDTEVQARPYAMLNCSELGAKSALGLVSRVSPVHTAVCNCTRDEGGPFEVGNQVLISSHRKLLSSKAMVVNVAEKSGHDLGRQG
jgi:hypothetical protein